MGQLRPSMLAGLALLLVSACLGSGHEVRFGIRNERSTAVIVQPDEPLDADLPAWMVPPDSELGWNVPNGGTVQVFNEACELLWKNTVRGGTFTTTLVVHADGTITTEAGIGIMNDPGRVPDKASPCP
jgi:hypothetical protein